MDGASDPSITRMAVTAKPSKLLWNCSASVCFVVISPAIAAMKPTCARRPFTVSGSQPSKFIGLFSAFAAIRCCAVWFVEREVFFGVGGLRPATARVATRAALVAASRSASATLAGWLRATAAAPTRRAPTAA